MSRITSNSKLFGLLGLRWKDLGDDWTDATHIVPMPKAEKMREMERQNDGYAVDSKYFPELAIWDRKSFAKTKDLFSAGGFYAVKGKLAGVLAKVDLGKGGLVPLRLYQEDMMTPEPGDYFVLNFSEPKNSFIGPQSENVKLVHIDQDTGHEYWTVSLMAKDGHVALSPAALAGTDIWVEQRVRDKIFMSEAVVMAIRTAKVRLDFDLVECRIVESQ